MLPSLLASSIRLELARAYMDVQLLVAIFGSSIKVSQEVLVWKKGILDGVCREDIADNRFYRYGILW